VSNAVNILVVEDDAAMRQSCAKLFRLEGYRVVEAGSGPEALDQIARRGDINIVLTDLKMPGMDGMVLLKEIKSMDQAIKVVVMTGYGSIQNAVEAMKHGAADYITKPFDTNELSMTVGKIIQLSGLQEEQSRLRSELRDKYRFDNIVGSSTSIRLVYEQIEAARRTDSTVLICGESGTGKELVAKAIHYNGLRAGAPFVPVNCAAMPRELIESELFGHKKGAFTGAFSDYAGLFCSAEGGTFSTRFSRCPIRVRPSCFAPCKKGRSDPSAGQRKYRWMSESSPPQIGTQKRPSTMANSAKTCSIA
jgi:two-component system NtrC family response regulator